MSSPLVDREGFPRSDIDVAGVRTARVHIIRLRNDLRDCVNQMGALVERGLPRSDAATEERPNGHASMDVDAAPSRPSAFAKVDGVFPGSPADQAVSSRGKLVSLLATDQIFTKMQGIRREDLIVALGSVNIQNHDRLRAVGALVNSSEGVVLPLVISRNGQQLHLRLTPRSGWGGRGLLG